MAAKCPSCGGRLVRNGTESPTTARCEGCGKSFRLKQPTPASNDHIADPVRQLPARRSSAARPAANPPAPAQDASSQPRSLIGKFAHGAAAAVSQLQQSHREKKDRKAQAKAEFDAAHVKCPHCGHQNGKTDPFCSSCSCPLQDPDKAFVFMEARKREAHEKKVSSIQVKQPVKRPGIIRRCVRFCAACIIVLVGSCIVYKAAFPLSPEEKARQEAEKERVRLYGDKLEAQLMAHQFVTEKLRSPRSAKFDSGDCEKTVTDLGEGKYEVKGWVDAQNAFGALLRSDFACVVQFVGRGRWQCVSVDIQGR